VRYGEKKQLSNWEKQSKISLYRIQFGQNFILSKMKGRRVLFVFSSLWRGRPFVLGRCRPWKETKKVFEKLNTSLWA